MDADSEKITSIHVVGGGDAGLLTALALNKGLADTEITVIDDFEQSVPEVGKSTLSALLRFLYQSLEIDRERLITNVKLAWKTTVYLKDWCGKEFHSPLGSSIPVVNHREGDTVTEPLSAPEKWLDPNHEAEFHEFYYRYLNGDFATMYGELAERPGKTPFTIAKDGRFTAEKGVPEAAYHFNSLSLNRFLRTLCDERGVELVDDRITEVAVSEDRIESIEGESERYVADLYVDATGFARVLMNELDNEFLSFDLPVDSAHVTTTDISLSDIVSATVVTTGDAGWFWQIDTVDVRDLGYVYSSSHISDEEAKREFIEHRDEEIDPDEIRTYRFESGVLERPWTANCVATGNALGFVEPLQSTALTTTALLAERLARLLSKHGRINHRGLRELYNDSTRATWEEVYDFVSIYYIFNSGTTQFWKDARKINPEEIPHHGAYQDSGFSAPEDRRGLTRTFTDVNDYHLYHVILRELGVDSMFYEKLDLEVDEEVARKVDAYTASLPDRAEEFLSYEELFQSFHPGFE